MARLFGLLFCLGGVLGFLACHRPVAPPAAGAAAGSSAEVVLLALSEAHAWQRRADLHLIDGDVAAAIIDLKELLTISFPPDAIEAEDVRLDACARLAKLHLSLGGEEGEARALAQIAAGRKLATHDSFFRAHLEMAAADIYEARASRLTDPEAQKAERRQALQALEQAIEIDRRLQRALLNLSPENAREKVKERSGQEDPR
jgi:tetratricopeptide (TPR) repeat protein